MGGFAQICRGFCKLGGDTDTGLKAPNGVNFNSARRNFDTPLLLVSNSNGVNFNSTKIYIFRAIKTQSLYFYALNLHKKQNSIDTK